MRHNKNNTSCFRYYLERKTKKGKPIENLFQWGFPNLINDTRMRRELNIRSQTIRCRSGSRSLDISLLTKKRTEVDFTSIRFTKVEQKCFQTQEKKNGRRVRSRLFCFFVKRLVFGEFKSITIPL